ncbi:MAG: hypothetical protein ACK4N5_27405, partial [Myxococcales bacterium]
LLARAVHGGASAVAIGGRAHAVRHAAVGSAASVAAAFAGYGFRRLAARKLPDALAAVAEDGAALLLGGLVIRSLRRGALSHA